MTKLRRFMVQVASAAVVFGVAKLGEVSAVVDMWPLVILAGALASTISHRLMARVIAWTLALGTAAMIASVLQNVPAAVAAALATVGLVWVAATPITETATRGRASAYDAVPENPWNAVDKGIDPTL